MNNIPRNWTKNEKSRGMEKIMVEAADKPGFREKNNPPHLTVDNYKTPKKKSFKRKAE